MMYRFVDSTKSRTQFVIVLALLSFLVATYWAFSPATQKLAFYMLPARFGELLIGALGALAVKKELPKKATKMLLYIGSILIVSSLIFVNEETLFPGLFAVPVCIGTFLLIISGENLNKQESIITWALSNKVMAYIGKISFSLYLVHWPVLAINRYVTQQYSLSVTHLLMSSIIIWSIAHFSWRWVETPFRRLSFSFTQAFVYILTLPSALLLVFCVYVITGQGLPSRFGLKSESFSVASQSLCHSHLNSPCTLGDDKNLKPVLLIGDSHAGHYLSYFDKLGEVNGFGMEGRSVDGCAATFSARDMSPGMTRISDCKALKSYIEEQSNNFINILIAERWEARVFDQGDYIHELNLFIERMKKANIKVTLLAQVPKYHCDVNRSALVSKIVSWTRRCNESIDSNYKKANSIVEKLALAHPNAQFASINDLICHADCTPFVDGVLAYKDDDHLNIIGAHKLAEKSSIVFDSGIRITKKSE